MGSFSNGGTPPQLSCLFGNGASFPTLLRCPNLPRRKLRSATRSATRSVTAVTPKKRTERDEFDIPESPEQSQKATKSAKTSLQKTAGNKQAKAAARDAETVTTAQRRQSKRISSQAATDPIAAPVASTAPSLSKKTPTTGREGRSTDASKTRPKPKANSKQSAASQPPGAHADSVEPALAAARTRRSRKATNAQADDPHEDDPQGDISQRDNSQSDDWQEDNSEEGGSQDDEPQNGTGSGRGSQPNNLILASSAPGQNIEDIWNRVLTHSASLEADPAPQSKTFKNIDRANKHLRDAIAESTSAEELRLHLAAVNEPVTKICSWLQNPSEDRTDKAATDFADGGLKDLIVTMSRLITAQQASLHNELDTFVLKIVVDLTRSIVMFGDMVRGKGVFVRAAIQAIGELRHFAKELGIELKARQRANSLAAFNASYRQAHRELLERERQQTERLRRLHTSNPPSRVVVVDTAEPELSLPFHPATTATAPDTEWTLQMDEELVKGLYEFRDRPPSERYLSCLTSPYLQNLSDGRIRSRALICKPSLAGWYDEQKEAVPEWVTSIE